MTDNAALELAPASQESSSVDRPKTGLFRKSPPSGALPDGAQFGSPPRRSKSQFSLTYNQWSAAAAEGSEDLIQARQQLKNWQLEASQPKTDNKKPSKQAKVDSKSNKSKSNGGKHSLRDNLKDTQTEKKMGEKLLMSKKKGVSGTSE